jgi:hypothetical protein
VFLRSGAPVSLGLRVVVPVYVPERECTAIFVVAFDMMDMRDESLSLNASYGELR